MSYPNQPNDPYNAQQRPDPNQPSYGTSPGQTDPNAPQVPPAAPPYAAQVPGPGTDRPMPPVAPTAPAMGEYGSYGTSGSTASDARPGGVTAAAIMTWVGSAILVVIGFVLLGASGVADELMDAGMTSEFVDMMPVFGGVMLVIGIAAIVLAILAFRRSKVGLYGLLALGAIYLIMSIISMIMEAGGAGVVGMVWVAVACGLLFRARAWFDQGRTTYA
ncbi:tetraspanin family protein [Ruania alkalisoli]|uniref:Tetraspanin family protein n=1 Tax=Ruania alkalisoli TaxID=2779775 RepID=A0A7M1SVP1_9MICO|nr:tetraspanin family protein [Ruania alkalisoli]QOR71034.1 tetraspanin family protein [Ruania alkalisoli]